MAFRTAPNEAYAITSTDETGEELFSVEARDPSEAIMLLMQTGHLADRCTLVVEGYRGGKVQPLRYTVEGRNFRPAFA